MTRALVVDDSHFMRTVIADLLDASGSEVVERIPTRAIETGCVDRVLPADEITDDILSTVRDT